MTWENFSYLDCLKYLDNIHNRQWTYSLNWEKHPHSLQLISCLISRNRDNMTLQDIRIAYDNVHTRLASNFLLLLSSSELWWAVALESLLDCEICIAERNLIHACVLHISKDSKPLLRRYLTSNDLVGMTGMPGADPPLIHLVVIVSWPW